MHLSRDGVENSKDRRKHRRFKVALPLRVACEPAGEVFLTSTEDIGEGGMAFILKKALAPGTPVACVAYLTAGNPAGKVSLQCRILRTEVLGGDRIKVTASTDSYRFLPVETHV